MSNSHHYDENVPVLIVGGGLIGLSTSLFLSLHGISSLMLERHPGTAIHPRATGFTPRTMEMFRSAGIEEAIRKVEPPLPRGSKVLMVESLVGQIFDALQEDTRYMFSQPDSPVYGTAIAQDVLEPILRARAEELGGDLRFGTELVSFEQDEEGVTAIIRQRQSGNTSTVRAQFLVAADGSQSKIRHALGIGQHGASSMGHFVSMIFEAELIDLFHKRNAIMCFLSNENIPIGSLVPYMGSSARSDIFRLDVGYDPEEETLADYPEERCLQLIQAAIGIPDFPVQITTVLSWEMHALVADSFEQGRIFLVGDAARTQPPSGGLGGNTGIAEAHNLAWKLATVLRGEAGNKLLSTYDTERLPIADHTAEQMALLSQQRQHEGSAGITVDIMTVNTGYRYSEGSLVQEEGEKQLPLFQSSQQWKGQPGTYAPHLMLEQEEKSISTLELFGTNFVLLVGPDGQNWKQAAQSVKEHLHLSLDTYQVNGQTGDLRDTKNTFTDAYGITNSGAILIRPDGFIAWRSLAAQEQEQEILAQVFSTILFR